MSKTNVRVDIPNNRADELLALGENIDKMNTELGELSPVKGLNIAALQAGVATAKSKRDEAGKLHKQAEKLNEEANLVLGLDKTQNSKTPDTILNIVTATRDILLGLNRGKEEALNDWGFDVVRGSSVKK